MWILAALTRLCSVPGAFFLPRADFRLLSCFPVDTFCQVLVDTMENTAGLRYIWSAVRPLMQGKVLYTPDTPTARRLVTEVRSSRDISVVYKRSFTNRCSFTPTLLGAWLGLMGCGLHEWV